ncbi:recombinase RecT [Psychrobacter cryohalolentis]|uniref:RecT family recombinase n=1 Tax=Psychrobacter sp. D2 TaxID=2759702 RepID=UPI0015E6241F|nr:RecT family recombinase [Psychrobacter sp. D2]MBA2057367.1 recombinase RecT [Psychrobacter sp. D2]
MDNQEIAVMEDQQYSPQQITLDDSLFNKCYRLAQVMASGKCTIPKHLQGSEGDCFAVIGQALRWGMDPFAVAQKTHLVSGTLGYEAQLVIAVINNRAPISDRMKFEYFGDWSKVKTKEDKSDDVGVICRATVIGDDEPTELSLTMAQVGTVRNSPLWAADPRQQLAYLAAKRFSRLHFPDVIMGVYTPDELADRDNEAPRNVTPKAQNAGASALLNRVKQQPTAEAPVIEYYDTSELLGTIEQITDVKQIGPIGKEIKAMVENDAINIRDEDVNELRQALADQKQSIVLSDEYNSIMKHVKAAETLEDVERMRGLIADKKQDFDAGDIKMLSDTLDVVAEDIGAQG